MEKRKWLQFIVSGVSLLISLALDLYAPQVKVVLCGLTPTEQTTEQYQQPTERIK